MKKSLFALALTLTLVGPMASQAFAADPLLDVGDISLQGATTDDKSPVLGSDAKIDDSYNTKKTDIDTDVAVQDSFNKDIDVTKTDSHDKSVDVTKTELDFKAKDSFNTTAVANSNNKAIDVTKTDSHDTTAEDSYNKVSSKGDQSPAMFDSKIDDSQFNTRSAKGEYALNLNDKSKVVDSNFGDTSTTGSQSPILGEKAKIDDSNFAYQSSTGAVAPNLQDSKIDDSNLGAFKASGEGLNTNLQDSKVIDSDFVNGDQDNSVHYWQQGQLNAADSKVEVGNLAGDESTIFDGDVSFGGGGYALREALVPGIGGGGVEDVNVNTGVVTDSVLGNDSQMANGGGIAINGADLGGGLKAPGSSVSLNNTQTVNQNVIGK